MSCLGCQHFISDWLGKLKPNKLSTGCQNELKGAAVEKATNPGRRFLFFSRLRRSFSRASRANFAATPLLRPARQVASAPISTRFLCPRPLLLLSAPNKNRHATQAILTPGRGYYWEILVGVCRPVLRILTLFQTKKSHFPHPFSDQISKIHTHFRTWPN